MKKYTVPVRFAGKLEYQIRANSETEAMSIAEEMASEEENLGDMEDINYEVLPAVAIREAEPDGQNASGGENADKYRLSNLLSLIMASVPQITNFIAVTKSGEEVAALRTSRAPKDEDDCIKNMLSRLTNRHLFSRVESRDSGLSFCGFPLMEDGKSFQYLIVCYGRKAALDQAFSVFDFVSNLYKLGK